MPLAANQKAQITKILAKYQRDVHRIVKQHKTAIAKAVTELEKKKAEEIRRLIG